MSRFVTKPLARKGRKERTMRIFLTDKAYREALFEHEEKIRRMEETDKVLSALAELRERIICLEERMSHIDSFYVGKCERGDNHDEP